ncbi:hypothetical protein HPX47_004633 [Vibrio alginolyticus]|nr:hypothetical protein [Vibrio alginolyticus]
MNLNNAHHGPEKYLPELHRQCAHTLNELVKQIRVQNTIAYSALMPIITLSRMLTPSNTIEQGGLCFRQIAHSCRVMGVLDGHFYQQPFFGHCLQAMNELGHHLGLYPSMVLRWQRFAKGLPLLSDGMV